MTSMWSKNRRNYHNEIRKNLIPGLTIIIPCYNAEDFIEETFRTIEQYLSHHHDISILIIDDKSSDQTIRRLRNQHQGSAYSARIRIIENKQHSGKGAVVCQGVRMTVTEEVCFTDVDIAYHLENITQFRTVLKKNHFIIANRVHPRSLCLTNPKIFKFIVTRHYSSRILNWLVSRILIPHIKDVQAGLKMARTDDFQKCCCLMTRNGFSFDTELLFIAHRKGMTLNAQPVKFRYLSETSTIKFFKDSAKMLYDLLYIRIRSSLGFYQ